MMVQRTMLTLVTAVCVGLFAPGAGRAATEAKLVDPLGSAGDQFGKSVAMSGSYAIVGAWGNDAAGTEAGKAVIFYDDGSGWAPQEHLAPTVSPASSRFGRSVDISGDYAVVGAPYLASSGISGGRAYVYHRTVATWTPQAVLVGLDTLVDDRFGYHVAIDGDTIAVGAPQHDGLWPFSGAVYIFTRSGTTWSQQGKLQIPNDPQTEGLGDTLDLSGDRVIARAIPGMDLPNVVYEFLRVAGSWSQQAKFKGWDTVAYDEFGVDLELDGGRLLAGASQHEHSPSAGAAYIIEANPGGGSWLHTKEILEVSIGQAPTSLGRSVGLDGSLAAVGGPLGDGVAQDSGLVYAYRRSSGGGWYQVETLSASDGFGGQSFGESAAVSGSCILVGAIGDNEQGAAAGAAYVYCGLPLVLSEVDINIICCVQIPDHTTGPVEFEIVFHNVSDEVQFVQRWVDLIGPDEVVTPIAASTELELDVGQTVVESLSVGLGVGSPTGDYGIVVYWQDPAGNQINELTTFEVTGAESVPALPMAGVALLVGGLIASASVGLARLRGPR
jgi:hypothetical protein